MRAIGHAANIPVPVKVLELPGGRISEHWIVNANMFMFVWLSLRKKYVCFMDRTMNCDYDSEP